MSATIRLCRALVLSVAVFLGAFALSDAHAQACRVTFAECCNHTVSKSCAQFCGYSNFASTCKNGSAQCKAKNVTPGPRATSHPLFSSVLRSTVNGKFVARYKGMSMLCAVVD